jgi:hypothetical protein
MRRVDSLGDMGRANRRWRQRFRFPQRRQNFSETFCRLPGIVITGSFRLPEKKTRIMKHFFNILLVTLFAVALAQLYYANMELKYSYEALAWQEKGQTDQFRQILGANLQRTYRDSRKISELEAQIKTLTTQKAQAN